MAEPNIPFSAIPWSVLCFALMTSGRADEIEGVDAYVEAARATGDDYTLAAALAFVASQWYVLGNQERCLPFAEEATLLAQRIGNPTLMALAGTYLGAALETTDPARARSTLETAIEHATTVGSGSHVSAALTFLARMGTDATDPKWATRFRSSPRHRLRSRRHPLRRAVPRPVHAGARQHRPCRTRRDAPCSSGGVGASHVEPDLGRPPK